MKKVKVLHLISHMNDGGAQKIVLNYLKDLSSDEQIEIKVLVYGEKTKSLYNTIIEENNYNVDYMFKNIHNKVIRKTIKILFGNILLTNYIKKYSPDIIHVHISPFITVCLKSIIKCNIPIRFDTLHSNPYRFKGKDLKYIRRAFQKEGFIGICVTNEQVKQAIDHYGIERYEVIHNGIDIEKIRSMIIDKTEARKKFKLEQDAFIIGGVGRLNKVKRFDFLLQVFLKIYEKNNKAILVIAGDGDEKEHLKMLTKKLGLSNNVLFLGNIENVIELYCAIDVLAVTSISESASLVLIESQVCGTRSVISDGVPSESIITNNVKKMDINSKEEEWAEALLDDNYIGHHTYKIEDYDVHNMSKKLKDIYLKYWKEYINGINKK